MTPPLSCPCLALVAWRSYSHYVTSHIQHFIKHHHTTARYLRMRRCDTCLFNMIKKLNHSSTSSIDSYTDTEWRARRSEVTWTDSFNQWKKVDNVVGWRCLKILDQQLQLLLVPTFHNWINKIQNDFFKSFSVKILRDEKPYTIERGGDYSHIRLPVYHTACYLLFSLFWCTA